MGACGDGRRLSGAIGKIRAKQGAETAVHTMGALLYFRRVVPFGIGMIRHDQKLLGTKLHTKPAAFAPLLDYMDDTVWHFNTVYIQRFSPTHNDYPSIIP